MKSIIIFNTTTIDDKIGGSFSAVESIIQNLKTKEYKIILITFNYKKSKYIKKINQNLIELKLPDIRVNFFKFLYYFIKTIIYLNKSSRIKTVWTHSPFPWFFFSNFLNNTIKTTYTFHGPILHEKNYSNSKYKFFYKSIINKIFIRSINKVDLIHYNSKYIKNICESEIKLLKTKKFIIEEILVSPKIFLSLINNLSINYEKVFLSKFPKNYILIPRRLVKRTGVSELINLILQFKSIFSDYFFVITGSGELYESIKKKIINEKNIIITGNLSEKDMLILKKNCFALIIPSKDIEGFSLIAKEGRILEKCIIHTNQGGLKESLHKYEKQQIFDLNSYKSLLLALQNLNYLTKKEIKNNFNEEFDVKINKLNLFN
tara:strand:+ start:515 stop:1639 length:1125 start_codon:yes stop_codon:yes gene_type:complete